MLCTTFSTIRAPASAFSLVAVEAWAAAEALDATSPTDVFIWLMAAAASLRRVEDSCELVSAWLIWEASCDEAEAMTSLMEASRSAMELMAALLSCACRCASSARATASSALAVWRRAFSDSRLAASILVRRASTGGIDAGRGLAVVNGVVAVDDPQGDIAQFGRVLAELPADMADDEQGESRRGEQGDDDQRNTAHAGHLKERVGFVRQFMGKLLHGSDALFDGSAKRFKRGLGFSEQQVVGFLLASGVRRRQQTIAAFKKDFAVLDDFGKNGLARGGLQAAPYMLDGLFQLVPFLLEHFFGIFHLRFIFGGDLHVLESSIIGYRRIERSHIRDNRKT